MADKQIIIDGCDVSGCEHFSVYSSNGCRAYFLENEDTVVDCENYPNCYYKQHKLAEQRIVELNKTIKAKEQECEKLKEENKEIRKYQYEQEFLQQQLDQLKSENEELKEKLKSLQNK